MFRFTGSFRRARRAALCGSAAFSFAIGCPLAGWSQQGVPTGHPTSSTLRKPVKSPQAPREAFMLSGDSQVGVHEGTLFYATSPLSEQALRRLDGTRTGFSAVVPLTVDRVQSLLFVPVLINNRQVRLILDTGGGPGIVLNKASAKGIRLTGKFPASLHGDQGYEPVTEGLARSMTLGRLTLGAIDTVIRDDNTPSYNCTLGTQVFEHYRVTLDLAEKTMTLSRGGLPLATPVGGSSLSVPFRYDNGTIFVPARVVNRPVWAHLDSGADLNVLSASIATAAAAQLPPSESVRRVLSLKTGTGDTRKSFTAVGLKVPVPISMNTGHDAVDFSTTSQVGISSIEDELHMDARLGTQFLLQFRRVIIDYPNHTLILQYPARDTPVQVAGSPAKHDKPWPGYKWLQKGYAWIEVPDGESAPPLPPTAAPPPTVTQTTSTTSTTIVTSGDGSVIVNGTKIACPPGSTVQVGADGIVHILPPVTSPVK